MNMMKILKLLTPFLPYKDLTINAKWDPISNSMQPESLVKIGEAANLTYGMTGAFIVSDYSQACSPSWGGYSDYSVAKEWGKVAISDFIKKGYKFKISFGGASGVYLEQACSTQAELHQALKLVANTYAVKDFDFDIEGAAITDTASNKKLANTLKELLQTDPSYTFSVTLPVLTTGLTPDGINVVDIFKQFQVPISVNIMAMDFGGPIADMGAAVAQSMDNTAAQIQKLYPEKSAAEIRAMIGVTVMIGVNDAQGETFTAKDLEKIRNKAAEEGWGLISFWSIDRDHPCPESKWAQPTCSGTAVPDWGYSQIVEGASPEKQSIAFSSHVSYTNSSLTHELTKPLSNSSQNSTIAKDQPNAEQSWVQKLGNYARGFWNNTNAEPQSPTIEKTAKADQIGMKSGG